MLDQVPPPTAMMRLYQVSYEAWAPPTIVAAMGPERALAIAAYGMPVEAGSQSVVVIDVTEEFMTLAPIAAVHTQDLIAGRVEGVVAYDSEDGWAYEAFQ